MSEEVCEGVWGGREEGSEAGKGSRAGHYLVNRNQAGVSINEHLLGKLPCARTLVLTPVISHC